MYKFENVTQGMSSYLSLSLEKGAVIDNIAIGMMNNNKIKGLLSMSKQWENQGFVLMYQVTSLSPLNVTIQNLVDEKRFVNFLKGVCDTALECGEYLMNPENLMLDEKYVYINAVTGEPWFVYVPVEMSEEQDTIQQFIKKIIHKLIHSLPQESRLKPILYEYTFEENFDIRKFRESLDSLKSETEKANAAAINSKTSRSAASDSVTAQRREEPAQSMPAAFVSQLSANLGLKADTPIAPVDSPFDVPSQDAPEEKKRGGLFGKKDKAEKPEKVKKEKEKKEKKEKKSKRDKAEDAAVPGIDNPFSAASLAAPQVQAPSQPIKPQVAQAPVYEAQPIPQRQSMPQPSFAPASGFDGETGQTVILQQESDVISQMRDGDTQAEGDVTQIDGFDLPLSGVAYLELIDSAIPGAANRIDIDTRKASLLIGRISSDEVKPDIAFSRDFSRIGRQHARIENRGGEMYITDLGSANHTLLNGQILAPNQPYRLDNGAEITFTTTKPVRYRVHR